MRLLQGSWSEILTLSLCYRSQPSKSNGGLSFAADFNIGEQVAISQTFYERNLRRQQNKLVRFGSMHSADGAAYFAGAVSYARKMFMKLTTGSERVRTRRIF
jgi:hypothetical protein